MMLSNYKEHPTKSNYLIFTYTNEDMAVYFKKLLEDQNIPYEIDESEYGVNNLYLFGVKTTYRNQAVKNNFLAYGKYRKPTISNSYLRYFLLTFLIGLITFAILGYLNTKS